MVLDMWYDLMYINGWWDIRCVTKEKKVLEPFYDTWWEGKSLDCLKRIDCG